MSEKKSIEYSDRAWNPFTGCYNHIKEADDVPAICAVGRRCWFLRMAARLAGRYGYDAADPFKPTWHMDRIREPLDTKKPTRWATCFMGDISFMFNTEPAGYAKDVLSVMRDTPRHRYYILSKRPVVLAQYEWPPNAWVGTTINGPEDEHRLDDLRQVKAAVRWVSFEPIYRAFKMDLTGIHWLVLGAQTRPTMRPDIREVQTLLESADKQGVPVFFKENMNTPSTTWSWRNAMPGRWPE